MLAHESSPEPPAKPCPRERDELWHGSVGLDSRAVSISLGELHVNSLLEPASGDGMIYIPQSRQGLDFSQVLRSRCWRGRWARGSLLDSPVPTQPLTTIHAAVLHLGQLTRTFSFI